MGPVVKPNAYQALGSDCRFWFVAEPVDSTEGHTPSELLGHGYREPEEASRAPIRCVLCLFDGTFKQELGIESDSVSDATVERTSSSKSSWV